MIQHAGTVQLKEHCLRPTPPIHEQHTRTRIQIGPPRHGPRYIDCTRPIHLNPVGNIRPSPTRRTGPEWAAILIKAGHKKISTPLHTGKGLTDIRRTGKGARHEEFPSVQGHNHRTAQTLYRPLPGPLHLTLPIQLFQKKRPRGTATAPIECARTIRHRGGGTPGHPRGACHAGIHRLKLHHTGCIQSGNQGRGGHRCRPIMPVECLPAKRDGRAPATTVLQRHKGQLIHTMDDNFLPNRHSRAI